MTAPIRKRGAVRGFVRRVFDLMATAGAYSDDTKLRRASDNYLAMQARDQILEQQRRQTGALEAMAYGQPAIENGSATSNVPLTQEAVMALLMAFERHVREPVGEQRAWLYEEYATHLGLAGDPHLFAWGAANCGFAVRRAEEELAPDGAAAPTLRLVAEHFAAQGNNTVTTAFCAAIAFADGNVWNGQRLDVMDIPGPLLDTRHPLRDTSLKLLTNPGSTFRAVPTGISQERIYRAWAFGYALRCIEMSKPSFALG